MGRRYRESADTVVARRLSTADRLPGKPLGEFDAWHKFELTANPTIDDIEALRASRFISRTVEDESVRAELMEVLGLGGEPG